MIKVKISYYLIPVNTKEFEPIYMHEMKNLDETNTDEASHFKEEEEEKVEANENEEEGEEEEDEEKVKSNQINSP